MYSPSPQNCITFSYNSTKKKLSFKSSHYSPSNLTSQLQSLFNIKNPIIGFQIFNTNQYYNTEMFYRNQQKFYGNVVYIIQAKKDQLKLPQNNKHQPAMSTNRTSQPVPHIPDSQHELSHHHCSHKPLYKIVKDTRYIQKQFTQPNQLNILFYLQSIYSKQIIKFISTLKQQQNCCIVNFFIKVTNQKTNPISKYLVYVGKKLVATLHLAQRYQQNIQMIIERFGKLMQSKKQSQQQQKRITIVLPGQQKQLPSFPTYQLSQALTQKTCFTYLKRMSTEDILKKHETQKLLQKCKQNFPQFIRIFCQNMTSHNYHSFKSSLLNKIQNNLQLLLNNINQLDLSSENQYSDNQSKSDNIQINKFANYLLILDQFTDLLSSNDIEIVKSLILQENQDVFHSFSEYLSNNISKKQIADFFKKTINSKNNKVTSKQKSDSANKIEDGQIAALPPYHPINLPQNQSKHNQQERNEQLQKQHGQQIKLEGSRTKDNANNQNIQIPPRFGSPKEKNNGSSIINVADMESNYKRAWKKLQTKDQLFEPQEYGLLYLYLQNRDNSICPHIQESQLDSQSSINKLKLFLSAAITKIMQQNFTLEQLQHLSSNRHLSSIDYIYQNFKYESNLPKFIADLHAEIPITSSSLLHHPTSPQKPTQQPSPNKSLDNNLDFQNKKFIIPNSNNSFSSSPKQNSFCKINVKELTFNCIQNLQNCWTDEFQDMIDHFNFTDQLQKQSLREAFKKGNPYVYSLINQFIQGKREVIDFALLKQPSSIASRQANNLPFIPIFSQILHSFVEQGKLSNKIRKWCLTQFLSSNPLLLGAFQQYIKIKQPNDFIDTLSLIYQLQNKELYQCNTYLTRIYSILKQMSSHDKLGQSIFRLYQKHLEAICEVFYWTGDIDELMDSIDLIYRIQHQKRKIKVATLNFSGINVNPFQYVDGSQQISKISSFMKEILTTEKQCLSNKLSYFDKRYTKNRYSVRFGYVMCQEPTLPGKDQYCKKWRQCYDINKSQQLKDSTEDTIQSCMLFDYYCYISVVRFVYGVNWKSQNNTQSLSKHINKQYLIPGLQALPSNALHQYLSQKHNRPSSNTQKKFNLVMQYFIKNSLDILFLQEAGDTDWTNQLTQDFGLVRGGDSIIIYRKSKFGNMNITLLHQHQENLQFNNDTAIFFSDSGYLLLSVHLASKHQKCSKQGKQLFQTLKQLYQDRSSLKIIIGIDANHFLPSNQLNFLHNIPLKQTQSTTIKQRTYIQTQFSKYEIIVRACKDFIFSNLSIKNYSITNIDGQVIHQNIFIPSDTHPYDHFVVAAQL